MPGDREPLRTERRHTTLSDRDIDKIREIIYGSVPPEVHRVHHEAIAVWVDRENRRVRRNEKVKAHIMGWSVIALLSSATYNFGQWIRDHWR